MNLKGIISISGKPGLFKVIAQGKNNLIVESLIDKKRFPAYAADRVSALEDISIYTYDEDVALKTIYRSIYDKENGGLAPSHKEKESILRNYLEEVLPNYDQERVYFSDIKKLFQWYNLLHSSGELKLDEEEITEVSTENKEVESVQAEETKPKKTSKAKKVEVTEASDEKPKAKKGNKKKADATE